jgi:hypothetical protein
MLGGNGVSQRGRIASTFLPFVACLALAGLVGACTNGARSKSSRKASVGLESITSTADDYAVRISNVVRTVNDPTASLDLVGDASGALGQFCVAQDGSTDGASSCACEFQYEKDGVKLAQVNPTVYVEPNLIRCKTTGLPSDLEQVNVRVQLVAANSHSNTFTFNFYGTGLSVDITNPLTYAKIDRYQCRDAVFVPYLLNPGKMYDPILSEDPEISYPLNFYASNFGAVFQAFVANPNAQPSAGGSGWICPTHPNDPADAKAMADLRVYSVMPANGVKLIYPPAAGQENRHDFWLPSTPVGVFQVPVNAYVAPSTVSLPVSGTRKAGDPPPPIGYGAAPIPNAGGGESCPAIQVPTGWRWVKVWLFRASLPDRRVRGSTNIPLLGSISCNPRFFGGTATPVVADCGAGGGSYSQRVIPVSSQNTNFCFNVTSNAQNPGAGDVAAGGDRWAKLNGGCPAGLPDPMGLCSAAAVPPRDATPTVGSLDGGISRYDYLFVVSPPDVMTSDFKSQTPRALQYTPYRYYSSAFCPNADETGCSQSKIVGYNVKFHDVTTNGDAPAADPGRLPVFPVCALQKP